MHLRKSRCTAYLLGRFRRSKRCSKHLLQCKHGQTSAPEHLVEELIAHLRARGKSHLEEAEIKEEDVRFRASSDLKTLLPDCTLCVFEVVIRGALTSRMAVEDDAGDIGAGDAVITTVARKSRRNRERPSGGRFLKPFQRSSPSYIMMELWLHPPVDERMESTHTFQD